MVLKRWKNNLKTGRRRRRMSKDEEEEQNRNYSLFLSAE
jgi:hypothetical protein